MYGDLLGFLPARGAQQQEEADEEEEAWRSQVKYRVTNNVITSEVAGMVINGMWGTTASAPLLIQPEGVDSLEPDYTCASAAARFDDVESADGNNTAWAAHLAAARGLYATLDGISGVAPDDDGFHASFDHYYDNLSARQCHGRPLPCKVVGVVNTTTTTSNPGDGDGDGDGDDEGQYVTDPGDCVTQEVADEVYRLGHWEYSQIYRDAGAESLAASVGSFGVWVAELAAHLRGAVGDDGTTTTTTGNNENNSSSSSTSTSTRTLWFHNVAHDGSVSRLLGILQVDVMVWPGMGSEVVFELWKKKDTTTTTTTGGGSSSGESGSGSGQYFVRVLWGGKVLRSSNPSLGTMDMLPVETLLA